jgi:DNA-3-methyladenine glycosylase
MPNLTTAKRPTALPDCFFDRDAQRVARELLGKIIRHKVGDLWLAARIIETEAYYCEEKGSHASLGYTEKRKALFLDGGHIYMYYARGGDSLNFSAQGPGNAVLIKSGYPWVDAFSGPASLAHMLSNNPDARDQPRPKPCCAKPWGSRFRPGIPSVSTTKRSGSKTSVNRSARSSRPRAWGFPRDATNT